MSKRTGTAEYSDEALCVIEQGLLNNRTGMINRKNASSWVTERVLFIFRRGWRMGNRCNATILALHYMGRRD